MKATLGKEDVKSKMDYEQKWKILAELLIKLQKKGHKTPTKIIRDLRSAKTMIQILKVDQTHSESISRIETYLRNVESYIIYTVEKIEPEHINEWLKKLKEKKGIEKQVETTSKFIADFPRSKNWMRVKISEKTSLENIERLAVETGVSFQKQENGYVIVYGDEKNLRFFVQRTAKQLHDSKRGEEDL